MKFDIKKDVLLKTLDEVIKAIDSNNILIPLRNFNIEALDNLIIIKGSNGSFSIESKIEENLIENIFEKGEIQVNASLFINIIRKCNGIIKFQVENNLLLIKNELDKFEINLYTSNKFPTLDFTLYGEKIKVDSKKIKKAIDNVIFSCSSNNEDIVLSGVNLKYNQGKLIISATDGFRLSREMIVLNDDRGITFDVTIHSKNMKNLIPSNVDKELILYVNEQKMNVIYENNNLQTKIIEAPYKQIEGLFQNTFSKKIMISKNVFNNALSKAIIVSGNADSSLSPLSIEIKHDKMTLSTNLQEIGKTNVIVDNKDFNYQGNEGISIDLNWKYLKDAINVFNDKININLSEPDQMILIDDEGRNSIQIISPIRKS